MFFKKGRLSYASISAARDFGDGGPDSITVIPPKGRLAKITTKGGIGLADPGRLIPREFPRAKRFYIGDSGIWAWRVGGPGDHEMIFRLGDNVHISQIALTDGSYPP